MDKTKIEWCDSTWNPVTGCLNNCHYCYARRMAERFGKKTDNAIHFLGEPMIKETALSQRHHIPIESCRDPYPFGFSPTFHRYRLDIPARWKKPRNIFDCSMGDLFGPWVPDAWIDRVLAAGNDAPQHRHLFLTKFPERYMAYEDSHPGAFGMWRPERWCGATITKKADLDEKGPADQLAILNYFTGANIFLSIEPIMEDLGGVPGPFSWIIIGAMTGPGAKDHQPQRAWVDRIVDQHRPFIPIFMKDSLIPIMGEENMLRQFPWKNGTLEGGI